MQKANENPTLNQQLVKEGNRLIPSSVDPSLGEYEVTDKDLEDPGSAVDLYELSPSQRPPL